MKRLNVLGRFYAKIHSLHVTKLMCIHIVIARHEHSLARSRVPWAHSNLQVPEYVFLILTNFMKYARQGRRLTRALQTAVYYRKCTVVILNYIQYENTSTSNTFFL